MKEKINRRWALKLLSFLCAFLVWLGVVNLADPVMTGTVEVPVEIENEEVLTANGLTYQIIGKKTATVTYKVKTTNAFKIRSADFRAYADMTDLWSVTGSVPIKVEVLNNSEYLIDSPSTRTSTIKIETEPLQRKRFDLSVKITGEPGEGYETGDVELFPSYVYVEGPESQIGQISSAGIEINTDGATADMEGYAELTYYDANGNKLSPGDRVESDTTQISYQLSVLKVKIVPIDFQVSGQPASGYRFTGVESSIQEISIVGLKSALASVNTVIIPGSDLDITGARGNVVKTVYLEDYIPANVSIAGSTGQEIQVTLLVEKLEDRIYTVSTADVQLSGQNDEYRYEMVSPSVSILVRALTEELDSLEISGADFSADVSSLTEGTHSISLNFELDPAYELMSVPSMDIQVIKVNDGPGADDSAQEETSAAAGGQTDETGGSTQTSSADSDNGTEAAQAHAEPSSAAHENGQ